MADPCPECGAPRAHMIGCSAPVQRMLAECRRDPRIITTLSPGSRAKVREKLGITAPEQPVRQSRAPRAQQVLSGPYVVNRHHYRGKPMPQPWLYIGRNDRDPSKASPLRNPFDVRRYGAKAIDLYREHLHRCVEDCDPDVMAELAKITPDHHLVCSCAPRPCHGDVVVEVWRELQRVDSSA